MKNEITAPEKIGWLEAKVCSFIAADKGCSTLDAFREFSKSKTHEMLLNKDLEMWFFSPEALYDIYKTELSTGDPRNSPYLSGE